VTESDVEDFAIMVATLEDRIRQASTPAIREAAIAALEEVGCAETCWQLGLVRGFAGHAELAKSWLAKLEPEGEK